ncbi:hypothetical protein LOTGIDRAFT_103869 [Lottia gigantea]|uniref:Poly [ADP-ribose] polymerase n=1 Tax=Lottia gigantea TaxID=225164 RepID=V4AKY2_LOTGI|nr:hypothetical protein LOTGIDRAFT_103869 [Lottia gigantea]ESO97802.1 hypothetical protein LOTGIDRAFT_103869 [Lottia gigantea]
MDGKRCYIHRISRVQNLTLWKYYALKKIEMLHENDGIDVNEEKLFHGTQSHCVEAISRKGFDWRVCGKHGTLYGEGCYFARNARYSHDYTDYHTYKQQKRAKNLLKMFLSKVLVGKSTGGQRGFRKPPPLFPESDAMGRCYDSCVDDIFDPKIWVIFDSHQSYPEYLVEYTSSELMDYSCV